MSCTCKPHPLQDEIKNLRNVSGVYREGLTTSFIRILTDDAVKTWKPDIQVCISTCTCTAGNIGGRNPGEFVI